MQDGRFNRYGNAVISGSMKVAIMLIMLIIFGAALYMLGGEVFDEIL